MSKSQEVLALAAMAPHLLGEKSEAIVAQAVRGNRSGAVTPGSIWELDAQTVGGVWYRPMTFTSFAAYKVAKAARARQVRNDAKASVERENVISRPACTGGKSYGPKRPALAGVSRLINNRTPVAPAPKTAKVKAAPQQPISRKVRAVANHVKWCLAEAASAAKATAKVARKAAKVAKMEKVKGEKIDKKAVVALKALQAAKNPQVQGVVVAMATKAELLRAWNRA